MRTSGWFVLLGLVGAVATPVAAQDATIGDLKCTAVSLSIAGEKKKDLQRFGVMSTYYFMGRLNAREPDMDFAKRLREVILGMSEAEYAAEADRCVDEFTRSADTLAKLDASPDEQQAQ